MADKIVGIQTGPGYLEIPYQLNHEGVWDVPPGLNESNSRLEGLKGEQSIVASFVYSFMAYKILKLTNCGCLVYQTRPTWPRAS